MTITSYDSVFELLSEENMAVIEDMDVENLKETIEAFAYLASIIGYMEVTKFIASEINNHSIKQTLRNLFEKFKEEAQPVLDKFEELISSNTNWPE